MEENNLNVFLGVVFILLLVMAGIVLSRLYDFSDVFSEEEPEPEQIDLIIDCPVGSSYVFSYKNLKISNGSIKKNSIEIVKNIVSTRNYTLFCWDSDKSYLSSTNCYNQTRCAMKLSGFGQIRTDYDVFSNNIDYEIEVNDGKFNEGLLCLSWNDIYDVSLDLPEHDIPQRLSSLVDQCYDLGTMNDNTKKVKIIFKKIGGENYVTTHLIDVCNKGTDEGYFDCGIKDFSEKIIV